MKLNATTMGMPLVISVLDAQVTNQILVEAAGVLDQADADFSTYKPDSQISRLNRGEMRERDLTADVREVLSLCRNLSSRTDGFFDIEVAGGIDPSGYVKGWAIQRACRLLDKYQCARYMVDVAGDIQVKGPGPAGDDWRIGVLNPFQSNRLAKRLYLRDRAVATSGTYVRGSHIYDPHTGQPVTQITSLTVVGDEIERTDAYATAAFAMGEAGLAWLKLQGFEAMLITPGGGVIKTDGFAQFESPSR